MKNFSKEGHPNFYSTHSLWFNYDLEHFFPRKINAPPQGVAAVETTKIKILADAFSCDYSEVALYEEVSFLKETIAHRYLLPSVCQIRK